MIAPKCDVAACGRELEAFGGILLSPPDSTGRVRKFHLCVGCYEKVERKLIDSDPNFVDK